MNTTNTRRTAATFAVASAVAIALTTVSVIAPTAAGAHRVDPSAGSVTHGTGSAGSALTDDAGRYVAYRKAAMAQYYVDHALELHQRAAG